MESQKNESGEPKFSLEITDKTRDISKLDKFEIRGNSDMHGDSSQFGNVTIHLLATNIRFRINRRYLNICISKFIEKKNAKRILKKSTFDN